MAGTKGHGATRLSAAQREETDRKVLAIVEKPGPLCKPEMRKLAHMAPSTIDASIVRLKRAFRVRQLEGVAVPMKKGSPAAIFEFVSEDEAEKLEENAERAKLRAQIPSHSAFRHPHDVAFFGEYERRAA